MSDKTDKNALATESAITNRMSGKKIAGLIALALWLLSIALSFLIAPESELIWVPDAVLLAGFFPLLWICPFSLIWIAFGLLTAFIGFFLLLLTNIPTASLPTETHKIKEHLALYHPCWSWMLIGIFVTICGGVKLAVNIFARLLKK